MAIVFWTEPGFGSALSIIFFGRWPYLVVHRQCLFSNMLTENEHDNLLWPKAVWTDKNKSIRVTSGSYMMVSPGYIL